MFQSSSKKTRFPHTSSRIPRWLQTTIVLKLFPLGFNLKQITLLPHTTTQLQLLIACLSTPNQNSINTQPKTMNSLCLGRREVYIGNMDGRWILFSREKDLSLEVVPSLQGKGAQTVILDPIQPNHLPNFHYEASKAGSFSS